MRKILGISAFYHDSAAALTINGKIIAAAQEERFTRLKNTELFPVNAINYCLSEGGLTINDLDAIVFYDKPLLKFERLLQTYYSLAPKGLRSFLKAMPVWLKEKLFLKKLICDGLKEVGDYDKKKLKLLFTEHHLAHAASSFFVSPFEKSAILTIDGVGEWCTASIGIGDGSEIKLLKEMEFPHSVGLLYSAFTYYLGFKVNSGEYKLMGLSPYGESDALQTKEYISKIKSQMVDIKEDGSIWLNQTFFNYAGGLTMTKDSKWFDLLGLARRPAEGELTQQHCNLALAIQKVTEEVVLKMACEAKRITKADYLCMAGGVALNCVANGLLLRQSIFKDIYIQPAAGDAGGALGAALATHYLYFSEIRNASGAGDEMQGSYLGPGFSDREIELTNRKVKAVSVKYNALNELAEKVAAEIANGKVVGWFQGRMEFGPRALGNRSILADPRNVEMQKTLNQKIKFRESFRPFAPSVLAEKASEYFDLTQPSPYMLFVAPLKDKYRKSLPANYNQLPFWDKLYCGRSTLPAITHLDFSARVQTVNQKTNPEFYALIRAFEQISDCPILVNTSFNVRGEPVVCTPFDAYRCFMSTEMDVLVIGHFVYMKSEQPDFGNTKKWTAIFKMD